MQIISLIILYGALLAVPGCIVGGVLYVNDMDASMLLLLGSLRWLQVCCMWLVIISLIWLAKTLVKMHDNRTEALKAELLQAVRDELAKERAQENREE